MDSNRTIDVGSLLNSVAQTLAQNQGGLNATDAGQGTHGDRMAQAFQVAAQAAQQTASQTQDAGDQFDAAAQALRQSGQGKATQYYADGLEEAAQQFRGRQGISAADIGPLLQSLAGGAQRNNPAQPGQGSMLDALLPAAQGFMGAQNQGLDLGQAAMQALGGAVSGAHGTTRTGRMDPGAASATNIISGIVGALLPSVLGAVMSGGFGGGRQPQMQPAFPGNQQGGYSDQYSPQGNDPLGGLGGLLGGLLGGGQQGGGGMFGGGGGGGQSQSPLGGLLGGLGGGEEQPPTTHHRKG